MYNNLLPETKRPPVSFFLIVRCEAAHTSEKINEIKINKNKNGYVYVCKTSHKNKLKKERKKRATYRKWRRTPKKVIHFLLLQIYIARARLAFVI